MARMTSRASSPPGAVVEQRSQRKVSRKSGGKIKPSSRRVVYIEDFDFHPRALSVRVGEAVEFRLADSVPPHAEHEVFGTMVLNQQVYFTSPLLQVFEFKIQVRNCDFIMIFIERRDRIIHHSAQVRRRDEYLLPCSF